MKTDNVITDSRIKAGNHFKTPCGSPVILVKDVRGKWLCMDTDYCLYSDAPRTTEEMIERSKNWTQVEKV